MDGWPDDMHVAHRGLYNADNGIIENSLEAFEAAIKAGFAIECDVQAMGDGTPLVFHDYTLERLTNDKGPVINLNNAGRHQLCLKGAQSCPLALDEMLEVIAGKTPLMIEIKSDWQSPHHPAFQAMLKQIADLLTAYKGPYGVMSFDPSPLAILRALAPTCPIGMTTTDFALDEWSELAPKRLSDLRQLKAAVEIKPAFLAHDIRSLDKYAPQIRRLEPAPKLFSWTIRTKEQLELANEFADHMIFEGDEVLALLKADNQDG